MADMNPGGTFPRPYVNAVPKEGSDPMMVTVDFDKMGIGARSSGLPKEGMNQIKSLEHVGGSAGKKG
jgi:hypothetical protein